MRRSVVWCATFVALVSLTLDRAVAQVAEKKVLTLAAAQKMADAAQAEAKRKGWPSVIAVVDDAGWPILIVRMDNAMLLAGVELAPGKARTAALFRKPSEALESAINGGRIAATTAPFIEMKGALPIVLDGEVVGAIGVSSDTPDHDVELAKAGLAAFQALISQQ
jgi:glc operon protein GlcG